MQNAIGGGEDRPEWPSKERVTHEADKEDKGGIEEDKGG